MFIVKIPGVNGFGKTHGCEGAGNAILKSLKELHSNEHGKIIDTTLLDLEEIHLDNSNLELTNKLIYENSFEIFETKPKTIFLGGDQSISYSTTKAFFDYCNNYLKKSCLIVFDAHADCLKPFGEPTNRDWLRKLIENGFPSENILLVGVRNLEKSEMDFLKEKKIKQIKMNSILEDIDNIADTLMEFSFGKETYVSLDIGVVDPIFASSTANLVAGGLTSRQIIYLMQRINKIPTLRAVDIVEINSEKDETNLTIQLGAKILGELI